MDATAEHPFFVYGHGWASCNPEGSIQAFGLKCQRLRVGDVCISLTPREREPTSPLVATTTQSFYHSDDTNQIPQNLSKKPETIPTTATGTTVSSRPVPTFEHCHQSLAFYASYLNSSSMNAAINAASMLANTTNNINDERRHQATNHHTSLLRNVHTDDVSPKSNHQHISGSNAMPTTCNTTASKHPSVSTIYRMVDCNGSDAQFSKKRRWSAPVICDDEMCRKSGQKNCNHSNHAHG